MWNLTDCTAVPENLKDLPVSMAEGWSHKLVPRRPTVVQVQSFNFSQLDKRTSKFKQHIIFSNSQWHETCDREVLDSSTSTNFIKKKKKTICISKFMIIC